jgi:hypothetical protein
MSGVDRNGEPMGDTEKKLPWHKEPVTVGVLVTAVITCTILDGIWAVVKSVWLAFTISG